jgi:hypothetical protein
VHPEAPFCPGHEQDVASSCVSDSECPEGLQCFFRERATDLQSRLCRSDGSMRGRHAVPRRDALHRDTSCGNPGQLCLRRRHVLRRAVHDRRGLRCRQPMPT